VVGGCSCTARLGGVHALGRQQRRCRRVRAAWVLGLCVQSSVMSDNYQSRTSECAKPILQSSIRFHPKARLALNSRDVDDLSVGTGRCGVSLVCLDSYSFEPRADAEWKIHDGHHLGVDAAAVVKRQTSQLCSRRAFAGPVCHSSK